eukprot:COSAG02_NODE_35130_length_473_cov_0.949198_1_plen_69_part_00
MASMHHYSDVTDTLDDAPHPDSLRVVYECASALHLGIVGLYKHRPTSSTREPMAIVIELARGDIYKYY